MDWLLNFLPVVEPESRYYIPRLGRDRYRRALRMAMETTLNEHDLAAALSRVLNRVRDGERFLVERNGQLLAVLSPPMAEPTLGITGEDLLARIGDRRMPGDGFADDIEAARTGLLPTARPAWPD